MKTLTVIALAVPMLHAAICPKLCCLVGGGGVESEGEETRVRSSDFIFDISNERMVMTYALGGIPKRETRELRFLDFTDDTYVQTSRYAIVGTPDTLTVGCNELCGVGLVVIASPGGTRTYKGEFAYYHR